jgi:hypothetical protein
MTCREREDDLHLYALDALEGLERAALERHLRSGCPRCAGVLAEARATAASLATLVPPVAPSPEVKRKLMAEITPRPVARPVRWVWPALATTAAAAAAVTFFLVAAPAQRERNESRAALALSEARRRQAETDYARAARSLRLLRAPGLEMAALAGQGPSPGARGTLLQDPTSGEWQLFVAELPPVQSGRTYEAWFITPREPSYRPAPSTWTGRARRRSRCARRRG